MRCFFISDIHIEKAQAVLTIDPTIDILFLGGDIGELQYEEQYFTFIETLLNTFKKIILVPGNHEFYDLTLYEGEHRLDRLNARFPNLTILDNQILYHENFLIFGACLWSDLTTLKMMPRKVPIYAYENNLVTYSTWTKLYFTSIEALEHALKIAEETNRKMIVVTHYAPSVQDVMPHKFREMDSRFLYCSDLEKYVGNENILIWAYGHTGFNSPDRKIGETLLITNQFEDHGYNDQKIYEIDENGVRLWR